MRKLSSLLMLILVSQCLFGQLLDSASIRCQYISRAKNYAGNDKISEDIYYLDAGKAVSRFYSANQQFSDSSKQSLLSMGLSPAEVFEKTRTLKRGSNDNIFKNYTNNTLTLTSKIIAQCYCYSEDLCRMDWELINDTITINGYRCFKAKCTFRGRDWIAWYAPEIPMTDGPWKLWGLPGLILKAEDSKREFLFESCGIALLGSKVAISLPLEENKNIYIKTDGKTFMQIRRKSIEDLKSSIASQGMTVVSVTDDKGKASEIPKMVMNAIEFYD